MNEIVSEKLAKLQEITDTLREFQNYPKDKFIIDRKIYFGAIYALVVGVEIVCDIGSHILSYIFGRKAETYKDIIRLMAEVEIIPENFAKQTETMTDFRNLAIHVYARVEPEKIYSYLPQAITQFQEYKKYFLNFIPPAKSKNKN